MNDTKEAAAKPAEFDFLRPPISLRLFIRQMGINEVTAWRWRNQGRLKTVNISGKLYIMAADLADFNRRANNGEFGKEIKLPPSRHPCKSGTRKQKLAA